ncbi:MAG TPA: PhzF family phenazine biosynthesis protein [Candidatus Dormibacteraeota bacterium]|nr:PhzF family phenazine biosynthesis protein [Candidatus Dormibacteraeota bacterium]
MVATGGRRYRLRWVDVFTERPLAGNPLAVVLDASGLTADEMQRIARETNLSETTFVLPAQQREHAARVRIFTPHVELPFAGHPTIGTAWVLLDEGLVDAAAGRFSLEEGVGLVPVRLERRDDATMLWMLHPAIRWHGIIDVRDDLARALGLMPADLVPDVPVQIVATGASFVYVALTDAAAVDRAESNGTALAGVLEAYGLPAVFLFARTGPNRLYSRMFGPHSDVRIVEDPATGSASGPLGGFAVRYGLIPRAAEVEIVSEQGTRMGRQSFVHIKLAYAGDEPTRIEVGGSVMPVMTAELVVSRP